MSEQGKPPRRRKYEPPFKGVVKREHRGPKRGWRERQAEQQRAHAERYAERSHLAAVLSRTFRGRALDFVVVMLLLVAGLGTALYIVSEQRAAIPAWVPLFGEDHFFIEGEISSAQGVNPGQGQPVLVAGVQVGLIQSVRLEDGHAVVGMNVEPKYAPVIRSDARLLLRPKTPLQDMGIQVEPGTSGEPIAEGAKIPLSHSQPNVNPDEFFARLDGDTRDYLKMLLRGGAEGLKGRSRELSQGLRRFAPFSRHLARLNGEIAKRREALAGAIHNFRLLTEELARHDEEVTRFVGASAEALGGFAAREAEIRGALRQLPPTLRQMRGALDASADFSDELGPTLTALLPQTEALGPGLRATGRFFRQTTEPIGEQIRPFTREIRPTMQRLAEAAEPFGDSVREFGRALGALNSGFNKLAFDPPDRPGYLFYLPWLNHNLNANYTIQDGAGPVRRGTVLLSCASAFLADGFVRTTDFLRTLQQATNTLTEADIDSEDGCFLR